MWPLFSSTWDSNNIQGHAYNEKVDGSSSTDTKTMPWRQFQQSTGEKREVEKEISLSCQYLKSVSEKSLI